jgi:hypothetical protein
MQRSLPDASTPKFSAREQMFSIVLTVILTVGFLLVFGAVTYLLNVQGKLTNDKSKENNESQVSVTPTSAKNIFTQLSTSSITEKIEITDFKQCGAQNSSENTTQKQSISSTVSLTVTTYTCEGTKLLTLSFFSVDSRKRERLITSFTNVQSYEIFPDNTVFITAAEAGSDQKTYKTVSLFDYSKNIVT